MFSFTRAFGLSLGFLMMSSSFAAGAGPKQAAPAPVILAAGSLTQAMNELIEAYAKQGGAHFSAQYGPSGKLRQEIEQGKKVDVFASASTDHTEALAAQQILGASRVFTRNDLCLLARPELKLTPSNFLDVISRRHVRLASSTPVSDPMGDYTWQFFRKADRQQPGLYRILDAKALKLSGAAAPALGARPPYVTAFAENRADAYIMYCTNAVSTRQVLPELVSLRIPDALNVSSTYGIAAHPHSVEGERFVNFVLQPAGQAILKKYGFQ